MGGWDNAFLKKAFYFRSEIWEKDWSPLTFIHSFTQQIFTEHQLSFPDSSVGKVSACNSGDPSSIPGSGRSAGEGIGYPLQYSFFFFFFILKLYNIVLVLPNIEMNPPQVYLCSPSWTLLPPPSPYHPSGSSQCTSPKHPVSCIEPGLVTRSIYDIIRISMPFSQIIPPSPSPTESKRLFYTTVFLLLSRIQGYCYHFSKFHIYALVYRIGVFLSGLLHSV